MDKKSPQLFLGMIHQSVGIIDSLYCDLVLVDICGCYLHQGKQDSVTYYITLRKKHHQVTHQGLLHYHISLLPFHEYPEQPGKNISLIDSLSITCRKNWGTFFWGGGLEG